MKIKDSNEYFWLRLLLGSVITAAHAFKFIIFPENLKDGTAY
jgi:hypothetical protein